MTSSDCLQCIPHDLTDMPDTTTVGKYSHMLVNISGFELRFLCADDFYKIILYE